MTALPQSKFDMPAGPGPVMGPSGEPPPSGGDPPSGGVGLPPSSALPPVPVDPPVPPLPVVEPPDPPVPAATLDPPEPAPPVVSVVPAPPVVGPAVLDVVCALLVVCEPLVAPLGAPESFPPLQATRTTADKPRTVASLMVGKCPPCPRPGSQNDGPHPVERAHLERHLASFHWRSNVAPVRGGSVNPKLGDRRDAFRLLDDERDLLCRPRPAKQVTGADETVLPAVRLVVKRLWIDARNLAPFAPCNVARRPP